MRVRFNNRDFVVTGISRDVLRALVARTSFLVEGYAHHAAFKRKMWDGRERLVKQAPEGGYVAPIGLLYDLVAEAEAAGEPIEWDDQRRPLRPHIAVDWNPDFSLRPYQNEAVEAAVANRGNMTGKVTLRLATRAGKTVIAAGIIRRLRLRTLFIVGSDLLLEQTRKLFARVLRVPIGCVGGGVWDEQDVTVASVQTLSRHMEDMEPRLKREKQRVRQAYLGIGAHSNEELLRAAIQAADKSVASAMYKAKLATFSRDGLWMVRVEGLVPDSERIEKLKNKLNQTGRLLSSYDVVFFDEAHHLEGERWREALAAVDARYKISLSATIWTEDEEDGYPKASIWVRATTGPIVYDKDVNDLIEDGFLVRPTVRLLSVNAPKIKGAYVVARDKGIVNCSDRNALVMDEACDAVRRGLKVLVVAQELAHVATLVKGLEARGLGVARIVGETPSAERQRLIAQYESGDLQCIVGTVFGEGVDIPAIECVINAEGGASKKAALQRFRNLTPAPGKTVAEMVDFVDLHNNYLASHSLERIRLYRAQRAFVVVAK